MQNLTLNFGHVRNFPDGMKTLDEYRLKHRKFCFSTAPVFRPLNAFRDFNLRMAAATSVNVKTSSFPKSIVLPVLVDVAQIRFNKSSKYSLHRESSFFSFLWMIVVEFLMEVVVLKLLPRNWRMFCQNSLFADE